MSLSNFFKINLPYGIMRNEAGQWSAFNREYKPLGENNGHTHFKDHQYTHTDYGKLSDSFLNELAGELANLETNPKGDIVKVFFYKDATNPSNTDNPKHWKQYFEKLQKIGVKKNKGNI